MASAQERRAAFVQGAQSARSSWSFADAATLPTSSLPYNEARAARRFGRALSPGEVGCFVSHYTAWKALLESGDEQRLVLEDDILVDWNTIDRLVELDIARFGIDLIRLCATHPFRQRVAIHRFLGTHRHLVEARGLFLGCQGYLLTRHAAQRLVGLTTSIDMPVDWFMTRYWDYGFPNYCLFPFPIVERQIPSNIGDRSESAPRSGPERIVRFGWRVADRISRGFAEHVRFRKNPFGFTPDVGPAFVDRQNL